MTNAEIKTRIARVLRGIAPEVDLDAVAPHENLREALDIDSFDFLNLLIGLHKTLGVDIPESDYSRVATLEQLVDYLSARVGR